ncbi:hypothetical protein B0T22DRAFT_448875 [Podospora appendiculata]|uniref:N-acetyltransferase domain-containing protein n=1 Tax=Podospora appendiculata TaxID=314037 RepID=A0AAE0XGU9_9PEZI|nr:hypothetical protein B0T22DRAFT_448875 [Podospora appendiculata]
MASLPTVTNGTLTSQDACKRSVDEITVSEVTPPIAGATIAMAPSALADNTALLTHLKDVINLVYDTIDSAHGGFWKDRQPGENGRSSVDELRGFILAGQLALAWRPDSSQTEAADLMGCVVVKMLDPTTGYFGLLMCDPAYRGGRLGTALVRFAEDWARVRGAHVMELSCLMPEGWRHAFKERLAEWYFRLGYQVTRVAAIADEVPHLGPLLKQPATFRIAQKVL